MRLLSSLGTLLGSLLGLLGSFSGVSGAKKMQTVSREIHFFESLPFGLSEPLLVLLGSSWPLPGPSWGPDGSQNEPKREPKMGPKMDPKMGLFLDRSRTHFGAHFGVQNGLLRWAHFQRFFIKNSSFAEDIRPFSISEKMHFFVFFCFQKSKIAVSQRTFGHFRIS